MGLIENIGILGFVRIGNNWSIILNTNVWGWLVLLRVTQSIGGGNGNPLQYSCLGNPMVRGTWWAAVHGAQRVGHNWATKQQT